MALLLGSHSVFAIPADPAFRTYRQEEQILPQVMSLLIPSLTYRAVKCVSTLLHEHYV